MTDYVEASFKLVNGKGKERFTVNGKTWERDVDTSSLPPNNFVDFEDGSWTLVGENSSPGPESAWNPRFDKEFKSFDSLFGDFSKGLFGFGISDLNPTKVKSLIDDIAGVLGLSEGELEDISNEVKEVVDEIRSEEESVDAPEPYHQYEDIFCDCDDCLAEAEENRYCCEECAAEEEAAEATKSTEPVGKFTGISTRCPKCEEFGKHVIKYVPPTVSSPEYFQRVCNTCGFSFTQSVN